MWPLHVMNTNHGPHISLGINYLRTCTWTSQNIVGNALSLNNELRKSVCLYYCNNTLLYFQIFVLLLGKYENTQTNM